MHSESHSICRPKVRCSLIGFHCFEHTSLVRDRAAAYIPSIVLERPVYLRETSDGMFTPITYLSHKILEEIVIAIGMAVAFSLPVYYVINLQVIIIIIWLLHNLVEATFDLFRYLQDASTGMDTT